MNENIVQGNKKKSYIWNTVSGMINAGQSALILIFISHNYTTYEVGLFSISYAIALLCMTLAKYGQRNYQVIDVLEKYTFQEYRISRWITIVTTMSLLLVYLVYQYRVDAYQDSKVLIIFSFAVWKMIDVVEDLFYGMYQQKDS